MTDFEDLRPLFDELDRERAAVSAALADDDMDTWLEHATRSAELHEEIARRMGWRQQP